MKKLKKPLYDIFIMVMPVMLGVYLGLLANNWNINKKERQLTEKVLKNLEQEVKSNKEEIRKSISYFRQLRDSTESYLKRGESTNPTHFSFWQGLNPPLLRSSSFESASITGVLTNLDLELLEQLSGTYHLQEDIIDQSKTYVQSVMSKIGTKEMSNYNYLIILSNYSYDQVSSGQQLLQDLEALDEMLILKIEED
ncbi:MAG: hypothetical protein NXI20_27650 [bacterium]|nr:hypothetical protein [bacterium]